jgi:hypothetical protein
VRLYNGKILQSFWRHRKTIEMMIVKVCLKNSIWVNLTQNLGQVDPTQNSSQASPHDFVNNQKLCQFSKFFVSGSVNNKNKNVTLPIAPKPTKVTEGPSCSNTTKKKRNKKEISL